jgi:hypothetical protein
MPDITTVNDLQGKTEGVAIAAATDGYVGNNAGITASLPSENSSYVTYKVNSLIVGNNDASAAAAVTIAFETPNGAGTAFDPFPFVTGVEIPAKASLDVLSSPLYLNDRERLKISVTGAAVDVVASYEQLTTTDV